MNMDKLIFPFPLWLQVNISAVNKQRPVNAALEREAASCLPVAVSLSLLAVEVSAVEEPRI